jgi:hypothetical protein
VNLIAIVWGGWTVGESPLDAHAASVGALQTIIGRKILGSRCRPSNRLTTESTLSLVEIGLPTGPDLNLGPSAL